MKQDACDLFRGSDRRERGGTDSRLPGRTLDRTIVRGDCSTRCSGGRHLSRPIDGGELSTRCSVAQRDAAQCERRSSAARASRAIRRAGRSDPSLRCLRQPRGWPGAGVAPARGTLEQPQIARQNCARIHSRFQIRFRGWFLIDLLEGSVREIRVGPQSLAIVFIAMNNRRF